MRPSVSKVALATLALSQACHALKATIRADTNHDGIVDRRDKDGEAIFIASIGDTDQRCSQAITSSTSDWDLDKCHDASDNVMRNEKYLAPVRTSSVIGQSGSISILEAAAASKVRIFVKRGNAWTYVEPGEDVFTAEELKKGLELGVDARDVRRPGGWDGRVTLRFTVTDRKGKQATDDVSLRVAPILTHHHAQLAEKVLATNATHGYGPQVQFVKDLTDNAIQAGIEEPVFVFSEPDIWTQDFFEPGYTSFPGPDGPIVLRVMIRSAQFNRPSGRQVFTDLRSDTVGAVQHHTNRSGDTLDSTGNLETVPPYKHNGKSYPAGRVIMGHYADTSPVILPFLQAQELQDPIRLDTEWLMVGHVDEFVQFLPADSKRGWVMMVDDPTLGLEILQKASRDGHGGVKAISRGSRAYDAGNCLSQNTIDQELQKTDFIRLNEEAARRIENNINILKEETGITDGEIFRVPALFSKYEEHMGCNRFENNTSEVRRSSSHHEVVSILEAAGGSPASLLRRQTNWEEQLVAHWPGTINGIPLSESFYLAPNPWGPVVNGKDILAEAVTAAYAKANYNVTYMDDWFSHHVGMGEIHCGSNTFRSTSQPWW
ncbi:Protein-arginine deiminase type-1 [Paramyrothecium foliicola]|nr:Protein-arginine deiminase type-1 [Paramyrothecium foliicola]